MAQELTFKQKIEYFPIIFKRDEGHNCFYCKRDLSNIGGVLDHLNNNRHDNEVSNLVFACRACNEKKSNDSDMQIKANEKKLQNEIECIIPIEDKTPKEISTEIDISVNNRTIAKKLVTERVQINGKWSLNDALNTITYHCQEKTGYGSKQSTRNYIDALTCEDAPHMIIKDSVTGKRTIVKRSGN